MHHIMKKEAQRGRKKMSAKMLRRILCEQPLYISLFVLFHNNLTPLSGYYAKYLSGNSTLLDYGLAGQHSVICTVFV